MSLGNVNCLSVCPWSSFWILLLMFCGFMNSRIGFRGQGTRIWALFASKSHWWVRSQWKSSFQENGFLGVIQGGEFESELYLLRNPIGEPGTNENRVFRKNGFLGIFEAGYSNLSTICLETPLVDHEPMEIELSGKRFAKTTKTLITPKNFSVAGSAIFPRLQNIFLNAPAMAFWRIKKAKS